MLSDRFGLLFVCHANLCRSPLAERLAQQAFNGVFGAGAAQIAVSSAGTHACAGSPMHPGSAQVLGELGIDAGGFASRRLTPAILSSADLVLTAERGQRAACVTMAPAAVRRTFTVRQFRRFVGAVPPTTQEHRADTLAQRVGILLEQVASVRHLVQPVFGSDDDLPDPVQQPLEAFRECADELRQTLLVITEALTGL